MPKYNPCSKLLLPLFLLLVLAVTACGQTVETGDSPAENTQTTQETPASTPAKEEPPEDDTASTTATSFVLSLAGDGLLVVDPQSGKTRIIPFKTDLATAEEAISAALGYSKSTTANSECGAGTMKFVTWSTGFTINVIQDQFVGWTVRPETESAKLTTVDGVGLGTTLTDLKANYSAEVIESSLGTEFFVEDSLSGLLSTNEPNAVVTQLWAGTACNFR